jgi:hypothetical protein
MDECRIDNVLFVPIDGIRRNHCTILDEKSPEHTFGIPVQLSESQAAACISAAAA